MKKEKETQKAMPQGIDAVVGIDVANSTIKVWSENGERKNFKQRK